VVRRDSRVTRGKKRSFWRAETSASRYGEKREISSKDYGNIEKKGVQRVGFWVGGGGVREPCAAERPLEHQGRKKMAPRESIAERKIKDR